VALGIQLTLNGLAFGGLVFLLAAGLSVIFGLMDVLNLAHGSFYMLGAYVGVSVLRTVGNFWLALLLAPILLALLGAAMEVVFFRRLHGRGHLLQVLLTFGFSLVFVDLVRWRFGPQNQPFPRPPELRGAFVIGEVHVEVDHAAGADLAGGQEHLGERVERARGIGRSLEERERRARRVVLDDGLARSGADDGEVL